ncbi:MAG: VWA domain-containing protein [Candidatus Cloacimonadota bacterium]|nr:MAG: VWA domain-containing protein [Candidatus Cloacimonadota bacterium]
MFRFAHPLFLLLTPLLLFLLYFRWRRSDTPLKFSSFQNFIKPGKGRLRIDKVLLLIEIVAIFLLVTALARPRKGLTKTEITSYGIDIVIALDISGSMKAIDFKPKNRLYVAKEEAEDFINNRKMDRIGLVLFARYAYTQCPLTTDHGVVIDLLRKANIGMLEDGTAIGLGLAQSCDRLKDSKAKSKVVILLTDGRNNAGEIDPETATNVAKALSVKVYTIGAGKPGETMIPVDHPIWGKKYVKIKEDLDEELLGKIAEETGGMYFRAKDPEGLATIFKTINRMEKAELKVHKYTNYREFFRPFLILGLFLLAVGMFLSNTRFLKFP